MKNTSVTLLFFFRSEADDAKANEDEEEDDAVEDDLPNLDNPLEDGDEDEEA